MADDAYASPYQRLGEHGIRQLVDRIYGLMAILPEARAIWAMHPQDDMEAFKTRVTAFMIGWFGGPDRYTRQYGAPRMNQRHMPFSIGRAERDAWLLCLQQALVELVDDTSMRADIETAFAQMADHLRNRVERPEDGHLLKRNHRGGKHQKTQPTDGEKD